VSLLNGSLSRWLHEITAYDGEWRTVYGFFLRQADGFTNSPPKVLTIAQGWPHLPISLGKRLLHWIIDCSPNLSSPSWDLVPTFLYSFTVS
jgi:hypothetical protein